MTAPAPRIGQGLDVHAFASDRGARPLLLGGVPIPDGPALEGHSDADVLLHALVDALLGAAALGDLGSLVGVDRPETRDAPSETFVAHARDLLAGAGYVVGNVDCTVVCAFPRIGPYRAAMRARIAGLLEVDQARVSVKATTTDGLGFAGRGEGIAAAVVVLLDRPSTAA